MVTKEQVEKVWRMASAVRGKDTSLYRKDPYGNVMYKPSYGKATPMGWEVDHIKPESRGGTDSTRNLQALNTSMNRSKGDDLRKRSRHS